MTAETVVKKDHGLQSNQSSEEINEEPKMQYQELKVGKKTWILRVTLLVGLIFIMCYNLILALEVGNDLIFYSTLMPIQTVSVFFIGWFFFKNTSEGKKIKFNDLVSVIIPIYNQKLLIHKVIDAISKSTYKNLEIIAVNDGSTDGTHKVLESLEQLYPRLKVISQSNGGKRRAVANGFYNSKGKYVVLIDSDSIVDKNAIREFIKTFQSCPEVGAVVGNGRVLNKNKNVLTKCQDAWYDYAFNIHKTTESVFGSVLCCSGCLAAYRRETIADFIPYWVDAKVQNSDDRDLTTYALATSWAKKELAPVKNKLMESMANYDDSEDRGLTAHALNEWKTVYVPSAVVHTEVPDNLKSYIRQQTRWKKGYLRSNFFVSAFFWRKHPLIALIFYVELMSTFISPLILMVIYLYTPLMLNNYVLPITYFIGQLMIGLIAGLDYKARDSKSQTWKYKPLMNMIASLALPWLLFPALLTFRKNQWLTR